MAKFPVHGSKQPHSTKQGFASLIPFSKRATSTAQLLLLVEPISKLLPGWSKDRGRQEGRFLPARILPRDRRVPWHIIISCPDLLARLRVEPTHLHGAAICESSMERLHNHLPSQCKCPQRPHLGHEAEEGQMSAAQRDPGGRRCPLASSAAPTQSHACWSHAVTRHPVTLPQHQLGAALTSSPRHGEQ